MSEFVYNEDTRLHTLSGKRIPSVSQVIEPLTDFTMIPEEVLKRKTELGTQFHEAIRLYFHDDLDHDSLDPDLVKPMTAFHKWWKYESKVAAIHDADMAIECAAVHPTLKYCGKPDLSIHEDTVYDFKLRQYNRITDTLQLEAYKHMISRKRLDLYTVCFTLDGKITMHDSRHPKAWGIFRKMLERWYREREFNNLMTQWKGVN
jgi:hypothetical protein